ncbi:GspE/PulE family protein [Paracidovorax wautersii]|uniref:Type II secretory pathway ATPase GspE/PulE or T4P pilus assembly pathway ATPase PilB n=1 Tax=Paracidovorax wautersii TaxID=1177982 RepID=A0A1I2HT00_9BURK|nr:ATPase, T2SS/T4P/T4SS family [Paracidovorax wautersii]SFF31947.1 Type II secretory pathway ATPase GspE/PulE or T4P pilus assembly pathway ATPase PilB [Paracidovorax wautersii]
MTVRTPYVMRALQAAGIKRPGLPDERARQVDIARGEIRVESPPPRLDASPAEIPELSQAQPSGEPKVISKQADIPEGEFLDITALEVNPLSAVHAESFAAIINRRGNVVCVLAVEKTSSRMLAEVMARLRSQPPRYTVTYLWASLDIVRMMNEQGSSRLSVETLTESDVEKRAKALLIDAETRGASDIHIETRGDLVEVLYRIHGKRLRMGDMSMRTFDAVANFLFNWQSKDQSRTGSWNKRAIQDAAFSVDLPGEDGGEMHVRFHSAPIHPAGNVQVVMRLLRPPKRSGGFRRLEDVLYTPEQKDQIFEMLTGGSGVVLVVGPTNSGKSSSLQSMVEHIRSVRGPTIKISTIENPVEYEMVGACQMAASEADFEHFLKATLRQDPDAVVVGEIRGEAAAETTKSLILAGHKILTTLHVYEAVGAFSRLLELGIPRGLLAMNGFIAGVVYQRLLPVVCPHCALKLIDVWNTNVLSNPLKGRLSKVLSLDEDDIRIANAAGCERCHFSGYVGRMPIAEVLKPDDKFLELIREKRDAEAKQYWERSLGVRAEWGQSPTALAHGIAAMKKGLIDPRDIEAELKPIDIPTVS